MKYVIGVDPGKQTGIAFWSETKEEFLRFNAYTAVDAVHRLWDALDTYTRHQCSVTLVCERYTIQPRTLKNTRQYDALEVTGALRHKCSRLGIDFVQYGPSDAKHALILIEHLLPRGTSTHAKDAACQVAQFLKNNRPDVVRRMVTNANDLRRTDT